MPLVTSEQLRAARAMLRIEQGQLAQQAGVSVNTISRIESMDGPIVARTDTVRRLQQVLEQAGVEFQDEGRPGVRLRPPTAA